MKRRSYYHAMVLAMRAGYREHEFWDEDHAFFCFSDWVEQAFNPTWPFHDQPSKLAVDGHAYHRRMRRRVRRR